MFYGLYGNKEKIKTHWKIVPRKQTNKNVIII